MEDVKQSEVVFGRQKVLFSVWYLIMCLRNQNTCANFMVIRYHFIT